jgi:hypothetical protein
MEPLEIRTFNKVHVSWISLMDKLEGSKIIEDYIIDAAYASDNLVDITCQIKKECRALRYACV